MSQKRYHPDTATKRARCRHPWCTECRTRRGSNRGNRRERHGIRAMLTGLRKGTNRDGQ